MFLKLGTTGLLRNRKKYLRILAISFKATCEGVYILQPPAYIFRGTRNFGNTMCMTLSLPYKNKNGWQANLIEPTKFDIFGTKFLADV